jgi:hypothetical protein
MKPTGWTPPPPSVEELRAQHERAEAERELEAFVYGEPYEYRPFQTGGMIGGPASGCQWVTS